MYNTTKILNGEVELRGDKSLSHRFVMISSIIQGKSIVKNISACKDVLSTINCLKECNINIDCIDDIITINGGTMSNPDLILDCGNSGSTLRMLMGLLFGQNISASFVGDASLIKRPVNRVLEPLEKMGAMFISNNEQFPIQMHAKEIIPIHYKEKTNSAQVKTALIFAGLGSNKYSHISYNKSTRDHTEKIMKNVGFDIDINTNISVRKSHIKKGINITIPGDISSASFIIAAAVLIPGSNITIKNVLYNKNRLVFVDTLINMGAEISIQNMSNPTYGIQSCDITAKYSDSLKGANIQGDKVIAMIDEIPIFCIVACFAKGVSVIKDAEELKSKESDRMHAMCDNLHNMKAAISMAGDIITIKGQNKLYNTSINHFNDHRIAMAFEIIRLVIGRDMSYEYADIIDISFPGFYDTMDTLIS